MPIGPFVDLVRGRNRDMPGATRTSLAEAVAMATAAAIAFSRLYLAVHNPTDVVLGALLGIACGCIAVCIVNTIESRRKGRQAKRAIKKEGRRSQQTNGALRIREVSMH